MKIRGMTKPSGSGTWRVALLFAAFFVALSVQPGEAQAHRPKFDKQLREAVDQAEAAADDDRSIKVIVKMRPGARAEARQKLGRHSGRVKSAFSIINGTAAELRARHLKELEADPDVVSISVDADVHSDGVASSMTGTPQRGAYNLRSTLGLRGVSSTSVTTSFRQGDSNGYASAVSASINSATPTTGIGTTSKVMVQDGGSTGTRSGMLLRFDNLFGTGLGQIPPGATITSASLWLKHPSDGAASATAGVHRMLVPWTVSTTWNSLSVSGAGLQRDNVEAMSAADASVTNLSINGEATLTGAALTATVQAWANGQPNHGWAVWQNNANDWGVGSSQHTTVSNRPVLTVTYKAPVNTTTLTGAGVTVAVVDSGLFEDGGGTTPHQDDARLHDRSDEPAARLAHRLLRPRHAHRGTHRGQQERSRRRGAGRAVRQPRALNCSASAVDQCRDRRDPVGDGQQGDLRDRRA